MSSDFSFMRTGGSLEGDRDVAGDAFLFNHAVVMSVFVEDVKRLSAAYSQHAGRSSVQGKDMVLAMKTRTVHQRIFQDMPGTEERLREHKERLEEVLQESSSEEEEEDEQQMEEEEPFSVSTCTCDVCRLMNSAETSWRIWTPVTAEDHMLKRAIEAVRC